MGVYSDFFSPWNLVKMNISATWKRGEEILGPPKEHAVRGVPAGGDSDAGLGDRFCQPVCPLITSLNTDSRLLPRLLA